MSARMSAIVLPRSSRLGARVVAVEPQRAMVRALRLLYGRSKSVAIEAVAVGREPGRARMLINADNPTVSSVSPAFVEAARRRARLGNPALERDRRRRGHHAGCVDRQSMAFPHSSSSMWKVLRRRRCHGLSQAVRALSFEFTTIQRDVALACIERCAAMGYARFNAALGESQTLVGDWMDAQDIARWLIELPQAANSGDIYAVAA